MFQTDSNQSKSASNAVSCASRAPDSAPPVSRLLVFSGEFGDVWSPLLGTEIKGLTAFGRESFFHAPNKRGNPEAGQLMYAAVVSLRVKPASDLRVKIGH
jgi:hypothetical protein